MTSAAADVISVPSVIVYLIRDKDSFILYMIVDGLAKQEPGPSVIMVLIYLSMGIAYRLQQQG